MLRSVFVDGVAVDNTHHFYMISYQKFVVVGYLVSW